MSDSHDDSLHAASGSAERAAPDEPLPATASPAPPSAARIFRELMTITAGVLIALSLEGLVQWSQDRALVREARSNIAREIGDNKRELETVLTSLATRSKNLETALRFANEMLAVRKIDINQLQLGFTFADLSTASWQTAGSTGALSHMDYAEVQRYSDLYTIQALYAARQAVTMERLAAAATMFSDEHDPKSASPEDLQLFRRNVLALKSDLLLEEQVAQRLLETYDHALSN